MKSSEVTSGQVSGGHVSRANRTESPKARSAGHCPVGKGTVQGGPPRPATPTPVSSLKLSSSIFLRTFCSAFLPLVLSFPAELAPCLGHQGSTGDREAQTLELDRLGSSSATLSQLLYLSGLHVPSENGSNNYCLKRLLKRICSLCRMVFIVSTIHGLGIIVTL